MSFGWRTCATPPRCRSGLERLAALTLAIASIAASAGCRADSTRPEPGLVLGSITIDGGARVVGRGSDPLLTATSRSSTGDTVTVPVVWRSTDERVATITREGRLVTRDTGLTVVTASALGVTSQPVQIRVVVVGAARIEAYQFRAPASISPGGSIGDSIRALVTTISGAPAVGATVVFAVTEGGGTITPRAVTVGPSGIAAAQWLAGPAIGRNSATATVVGQDSAAISFVRDNPARFTATSYAALSVVQGDGQTGQVLATLPTAPAVRLVDSSGAPRPGVPVTFRPPAHGRVVNTTVSTSADGVASPGQWTLGDETGEEQLIVTVEGATVRVRATATGAIIRFGAARVATAQSATCALANDQSVRCMGQWPQNGSGTVPSNRSSPTLIQSDVRFSSLAGGGAHFCGVATDGAIYCWGSNAYPDTSGAIVSTGSPMRLASSTAWQQVAPGSQHNCAIATGAAAYCWGTNGDGQLGDNGSTTRFVPQPVAGGFSFASITSGDAHSCGVALDGAAFCWGANGSGQLGDGTLATRRTPTAVSGGLKWLSLGAGTGRTCGLLLDGVAYCWGAGTGRQVPEPYPNSPAFSFLTVGAAHQCTLTDAGVAYCWGDNSGGQLGDSTTTGRTSPTLVATTLRFTSLSAGAQHTCGVTVSGDVACWGRNQFGELGFSFTHVQLVPRYIALGVTP